MARRKPVFEDIMPPDRKVMNPSGLVTELAPPTPYGISHGTDTGGWEKVAEMILSDVDTPVLWVPDTCVKINPVANCFWEAAREAHSISFRPQVLLTEPIKRELSEWINDPRDRPDLAKAVRESIDTGSGFLRYTGRTDIAGDLAYAFNSYLYMTSIRRYLGIPNDEGKMLPGADPNNLSLTMSKIAEQFGPIAQGFARAGHKDVARNGVLNINDESMVVLSFFWAIQNENPICLVTTDRHVFNIFFKLQCMVDLHYRSYLAASLAAGGYYGSSTEYPAEKSNEHFSGVCELYPQKTPHFDEVLMPREKHFSIELILVQHDGALNYLKYTVEPEIKHMLLTRSRTSGRNTELFGDRNFYVDTGGFTGEMLGHMCVALDIMFETNVLNLSIPRLDVSFAINQTEQFLDESMCISRDDDWFGEPKDDIPF